MTCAKCGGGPISGPRYEGKGCNERLRYSCGRCGYSWMEPCADAREPKRPDDQEIRRLKEEIQRHDDEERRKLPPRPYRLPEPEPWRTNPWRRPRRDDDDWPRLPSPHCTLNKPLLLVIPHGGMTISCPVHPEGHFIRGTEIMCSAQFRSDGLLNASDVSSAWARHDLRYRAQGSLH